MLFSEVLCTNFGGKKITVNVNASILYTHKASQSSLYAIQEVSQSTVNLWQKELHNSVKK